jgi:hypothetical protein
MNDTYGIMPGGNDRGDIGFFRRFLAGQNRSWNVAEFTGGGAADGARAARDMLRAGGIDAFMITTGSVATERIFWVQVRGGNILSLKLAALYAKSQGEHGDLAAIMAMLEPLWPDERSAQSFHTLLEETGP